jgi:hypothetical protein
MGLTSALEKIIYLHISCCCLTEMPSHLYADMLHSYADKAGSRD